MDVSEIFFLVLNSLIMIMIMILIHSISSCIFPLVIQHVKGFLGFLGDVKSIREKMENKVEGVKGKGLSIVFINPKVES